MRLAHITIAGFRGVKHRLDIKVPQGFLIVTGRNGSGKSSLCDAIEFALSGRLRRQLGDTERRERIDDYIWWRGDKEKREKFVQCVFVTEEGTEFSITRTPEGVRCEPELEIAEAFCDLETAPVDAMNRLLATSMIRDEDITRLSIDLEEAERWRFVREAIGDSNLTALTSAIEEVCKVLRKRAETTKSEYSRTRDVVEAGLERLSELRALVASEEQLAEAQAAVADLIEADARDIGPARLRVAEWSERSASARSLADDLMSIQESRKTTAALEERARKLELELAELSANAAGLRGQRSELEAAIHKLEGATAEHNALAELLQVGEQVGLADGCCPLCGSRIEESQFLAHIDDARAEIEEKAMSRASLVPRLNAVVAEEERIRGTSDILKHDLEVSQNRPRELDAQEGSCIERAQQEFGLLGSDSSEAISFLLGLAEDCSNKAAQLTRALRIVESSRLREEIDSLTEEVGRARLEAATLGAEAEHTGLALSQAKRYSDAVLRLEKEIVDERLSALGPLLEELYVRLRPHTDWVNLSYKIRGDVKHFLSLEVGDDLNPRFMFSSGQRRAIGIAFLVAVYLGTGWSRLKSLILDDPVQHIDDYRSLHLVELLAAISKSPRQLICTAEDASLADLMARRLKGVAPGAGAVLDLEYVPGSGSQIRSLRTLDSEGVGAVLLA